MNHFLGKARRHKPLWCDGCGELLTGNAPIDLHRAKPDPGDWSICMHCGNLAIFADDLSLRPLTEAEAREAEADETIMAALRAQKQAIKDN